MMNRLFIRGALLLSCSLLASCSSTPKNQDVAVKQEIIKPDAAVWLSEKESLLRDSIKGSVFTLHKQDNAWVVTAPAQYAFNPDRPSLLLPAALGPITRIAKLLEADAESSVLILGHAAQSTDNQKLSTDRARSVASIFRLSGLKGARMRHLGMGSSYLLDQSTSNQQNHRVEIIVMPSIEVQGMMAVYHPAYVRQLALSQGQ